MIKKIKIFIRCVYIKKSGKKEHVISLFATKPRDFLFQRDKEQIVLRKDTTSTYFCVVKNNEKMKFLKKVLKNCKITTTKY